MSIQSAMEHMNKDHKESLVNMVRKHAKTKKVDEVSLTGLDLEGLEITYNGGEKVRIVFPAKLNSEEELHQAIVALSMDAGRDIKIVEEDMEKFMDSYNSICIASLSPENHVVCTYAPLLRDGKDCYIYISEISEHYKNLRTNPKNVEIMFLEDECKAKSPIVRQRLRFRTEVEFIERGELFDRVYDNFEQKTNRAVGVKTIRSMMDFHLVRLHFKEGRYVKGFGQAFDITADGVVKFAGGGGGMPHKGPHGHGGHGGGHK